MQNDAVFPRLFHGFSCFLSIRGAVHWCVRPSMSSMTPTEVPLLITETTTLRLRGFSSSTLPRNDSKCVGSEAPRRRFQS